jgi:hypothetical protein
VDNFIKKVYSYSLIGLSLVSLLGLLATGHEISIESGQLILFFEIAVYFLTGLTILRKGEPSKTLIIILLTLTQIGLIEMYTEIIKEFFSIGITSIFIILTALTLFIILKEYRTTN